MADSQLIVVMGVSGSGKTTLARGLAERLGWRFLEGDELHPQANVEKMSAGTPLTDEDREPWLARLAAWLDERAAAGESAVVTCSALKRGYRDVLTDGRPGVRFCHVQAGPELIRRRVEQRRGHYMPASLVPSQLQALEPLAPEEPGVVVTAEGEPREVLEQALRKLGLDVA